MTVDLLHMKQRGVAFFWKYLTLLKYLVSRTDYLAAIRSSELGNKLVIDRDALRNG